MNDSILVHHVIDPIIPDILRQIDARPDQLFSSSFLTKALPHASGNSTEGLAKKHSVRIAVLIGMKPGLEVLFNIAGGFLIDRYSAEFCLLR